MDDATDESVACRDDGRTPDPVGLRDDHESAPDGN
jgi:hypothetical protein